MQPQNTGFRLTLTSYLYACEIKLLLTLHISLVIIPRIMLIMTFSLNSRTSQRIRFLVSEKLSELHASTSSIYLFVLLFSFSHLSTSSSSHPFQLWSYSDPFFLLLLYSPLLKLILYRLNLTWIKSTVSFSRRALNQTHFFKQSRDTHLKSAVFRVVCVAACV